MFSKRRRRLGWGVPLNRNHGSKIPTSKLKRQGWVEGEAGTGKPFSGTNGGLSRCLEEDGSNRGKKREQIKK